MKPARKLPLLLPSSCVELQGIILVSLMRLLHLMLGTERLSLLVGGDWEPVPAPNGS